MEKPSRPSWDEYFLAIGNAVAARSTCDRGKASCVIVRDKHILVTGYAGAPPGFPHCDEVGHQMKSVTHEDGTVSQHCMRTTHAEQNALMQAAKFGLSIDGGTLYAKMTPCATCAKLIVTAGIKRVVCEKRYHAGDESEKMFRQAGIAVEFKDSSLESYARQ